MSKNGRVLFVIHDCYQDDNCFLSGVWYLADVLKKNGSELKIFAKDIFHYTNDELTFFYKKVIFECLLNTRTYCYGNP